MDQLLSKAGSTLVTFAVRSGVQVASNYVIKSVSHIMEHVPQQEKKKLERKRSELYNKIDTLTYSIGVLQLLAARGNSNLDSVLKLTDYLNEDINEFTEEISMIIASTGDKNMNTESVKLVVKLIDELARKIDTIVPILNLVLTTFGTSSVNNFQDYVSPGRLLNATVLVKNSNNAFTKNRRETRVGPVFSMVFYSVFYNHQPTNDSKIIWREKFARSKFEIVRIVNERSTFAYEIRVTEDFNDERYHDESEEKPETKVYDIRQISKVFFSASGRLLKLQDKPTPVLVFKVRKGDRESIDEFVANGASSGEEKEEDFEWIAIGDYEEPKGDDSDEDDSGESDYEDAEDGTGNTTEIVSNVKTTGSLISLLEYLIRLCTLQANDQIDILNVKDERLRLYLADENYSDSKSNQIPSLNKTLENLKI